MLTLIDYSNYGIRPPAEHGRKFLKIRTVPKINFLARVFKDLSQVKADLYQSIYFFVIRYSIKMLKHFFLIVFYIIFIRCFVGNSFNLPPCKLNFLDDLARNPKKLIPKLHTPNHL